MVPVFEESATLSKDNEVNQMFFYTETGTEWRGAQQSSREAPLNEVRKG